MSGEPMSWIFEIMGTQGMGRTGVDGLHHEYSARLQHPCGFPKKPVTLLRRHMLHNLRCKHPPQTDTRKTGQILHGFPRSTDNPFDRQTSTISVLRSTPVASTPAFFNKSRNSPRPHPTSRIGAFPRNMDTNSICLDRMSSSDPRPSVSKR